MACRRVREGIKAISAASNLSMGSSTYRYAAGFAPILSWSIARSFAISSENDIPSGLFIYELLGVAVFIVTVLAFIIEKLF